MTVMKDLISVDGSNKTYDRYGIEYIPGGFDEAKINAFHQSIVRLTGAGSLESLLSTLKNLEASEKQRFYEICTRQVWFQMAGLNLISDSRVCHRVASILDCDVGELSPVGHALFWNDPDCLRLQYKWHQEASYYPGMNNVVSLWFPLVYDLSDFSGPMIVAAGSHQEALTYKKSSYEGSVTQLEIQDRIADQFPSVSCSISVGDLVLFHQNLIHKTGDNSTNIPRLSGIIRYACLRKEGKEAAFWDINRNF